MTPTVFISHSQEGRSFAERDLLPLLQSHGVETWFSEVDIEGGEWPKKIQAALEKSDWFLLVMTPDCAESYYIEKELNWWFDAEGTGEKEKGRIIPVLHQKCAWKKIHLGLAGVQIFDFTKSHQDAADRLVRAFGVPVSTKSQTSDCVFASKLAATDAYIKKWNQLRKKLLSSLDVDTQAAIEQMRETLDDAFCDLRSQLESPELTIATAGTTSGGKSTLVNLLCGTKIVPSAVSEMSAGIVSIHDARTRNCDVIKTSGATWECRKWNGITHDRIRDKLQEIMERYLQESEQEEAPDHPLFKIEFPIGLVEELRDSGLPDGCKCRLLDLPGIKHLEDAKNSQLVEQCSEALCLLTYNSEETDPVKQEGLLIQVVNQVKELGGSPNRMVFVLNKIDVFRKDSNWQASEKKHVRRVTNQIKKAIAQHLPEHAGTVQDLKIVTLSSDPALSAKIIRSGSKEERIAEADRIINHYRALLSKDTLRCLPNVVEDWDDEAFEAVAAEIEVASRCDQFEGTLRQHIKEHLATLIMTPAVDAFARRAAQPAIDLVRQNARANLNRSGERYEQECKKTQQSSAEIRKAYENSRSEILKPFQSIKKKLQDDSFRYSHDLIARVKQELDYLEKSDSLADLPKGATAPLHAWPDVLDEAIESVLWAITGQAEGDFNQEKLAEILPGGTPSLLRRAVTRLKNAGYGKQTRMKGVAGETNDPKQIEKIDKIILALGEFEKVVEQAVQHAINAAAHREIRRIYSCLERLVKFALDEVAEKADSHTTLLWGGSAALSTAPIDRTLKLNLSLNASFDVTEEVIAKMDMARFPWYDLRRWLGQRKVANFKERKVKAKIPPIKAVINVWKVQLAYKRPDVIEEVNDWLIEHITSVWDSVSDVQQDLVASYEEALRRAHANAASVKETRVALWSDAEQECEELNHELRELRSSR